MLLRSSARQSSVLVRSFHSSTRSQGFLDWFNHQKSSKAKKVVETPENIDNVISKAENDQITTTRVEKIEFIGKKVPAHELLPLEERLNGFKIDKWLKDDKIVHAEDFEDLILNTYNNLVKSDKPVDSLEDVVLDDLNLRFELTKIVQAESGYIIPDYILTKSYNGQILQNYFDQRIVTGDYLIKNKSHLPIESLEYESPNISIQPNVTSRDRKLKFKQLVKDAKQYQKEKAEKLIEEVRA